VSFWSTLAKWYSQYEIWQEMDSGLEPVRNFT
jgi:hypothetical protein